MTDWFYTEHYLINTLRLWCSWTIGVLMGMFIQKNRQAGILRFKRLKARLTKKEESK